MLPLFHQCINFSFLIFISATLVACGGGGGSTPPPPKKDIVAPLIVGTVPSSEQADVNLRSFIKVTFSELIATVTTDQVTIYPFLNGEVDMNSPIPLNNSDSFIFDNSSKTLEVRLKVGDLKTNNQYQVIVENIKDISGNPMLGICRWEFTTINAPAITTGNTGLCGKIVGVTGEPQNLTAIAGDGNVTLNWQVPLTGTADYYRIEVSTDNAVSFSLVKDNFSTTVLSYSDSTVQNGTSYIYRVIAVNAVGDSVPAMSNTVSPKVIFVSLKNSIIVTSPAPIIFSEFGFALALSPDGLTLAASEIGGSGIVYIFNKSGNNWLSGQKLISATQFGNDRFGQQLIFTPDGKSLIVAESSGTFNTINNAGTVEIFKFINVNTGWQSAQVIGSQLPGSFNYFGGSISLSADGKTLAIGESGGDTVVNTRIGVVDIYYNNAGTWGFVTQLNSQTPKSGNAFGYDIALTSTGNTIAISETSGSNTVQVFNKTGANWIYSQTLDTQRASTTGFGSVLLFSPDDNTLLVSDLIGNADTGVVQLFNKTGSSWSVGQELSSSLPAAFNYFGNALAFSADGNVLAIGEYNGDIATTNDVGTVALFAKSGTTWNSAQIVTASTPVGGRFGISIAFDGTTLVVGDTSGKTANTVNSVGIVHIFSK